MTIVPGFEFDVFVGYATEHFPDRDYERFLNFCEQFKTQQNQHGQGFTLATDHTPKAVTGNWQAQVRPLLESSAMFLVLDCHNWRNSPSAAWETQEAAKHLGPAFQEHNGQGQQLLRIHFAEVGRVSGQLSNDFPQMFISARAGRASQLWGSTVKGAPIFKMGSHAFSEGLADVVQNLHKELLELRDAREPRMMVSDHARKDDVKKTRSDRGMNPSGIFVVSNDVDVKQRLERAVKDIGLTACRVEDARAVLFHTKDGTHDKDHWEEFRRCVNLALQLEATDEFLRIIAFDSGGSVNPKERFTTRGAILDAVDRLANDRTDLFKKFAGAKLTKSISDIAKFATGERPQTRQHCSPSFLFVSPNPEPGALFADLKKRVPNTLTEVSISSNKLGDQIPAHNHIVLLEGVKLNSVLRYFRADHTVHLINCDPPQAQPSSPIFVCHQNAAGLSRYLETQRPSRGGR
jgi:hypothetical protein